MIIRLLFNFKCVFLQSVYLLSEFNQYVELQTFLQNISWFIYNRPYFFLIYSLNLKIWPPDFFLIFFWFIYQISIFYHQNIKRKSLIFFKHFNMASLLHIIWIWFHQEMWFLFQWFQFLTLLIFTYLLNILIKTINKVLLFPNFLVTYEKGDISL